MTWRPSFRCIAELPRRESCNFGIPLATIVPMAGTTFVEESGEGGLVVSWAGRFVAFARRLGSGLSATAEGFFGVTALILGLSILSILPLGQWLSLGYLLESSGRVARTGRLRDGVIGFRTAA